MSEPTGTRPPPGGRVPRLGADSERSARREFQRRVLRGALIVDAVVVVTLLVGLLAWRLRAVLLLIVIALFMTLLLHPLVSFLERRNMRRGLATGIVFVGGFGLLAVLLFVLLQPAVTGAENLAKELPVYIREAQHGRGAIGHLVAKLHLTQYVTAKNGGAQALISKFGKPALSIGKGVLSGVVGVVTIVFLTFFLLIHAPGIYRGVLSWMQPERSQRVRDIVSDVERSVVGYMAGDFATSLVAGVVITVTLLATGVPYPLVLGVWVAVVDFLPLVGGLLAGVPTVVIALLHSTTAGVVTFIVFIVYQQIENHVLYPIVMSRTVKLNSLWVLISVLIGASLGNIVGSVFGGFVGALLAVPAGSAVQVIARDLWQHRSGAVLLSDEAGGPPASEGTAAIDTGVMAVRRAPAPPSAPEAGGGTPAADGTASNGAAPGPRPARRRRRRPPRPRPG
ncbi:MAG TPA: AI-2E family transporter [Acidimicrobiales bacterium]|nr:AI-2E family transporter [Acidimicrobiales bacterium]